MDLTSQVFVTSAERVPGKTVAGTLAVREIGSTRLIGNRLVARADQAARAVATRLFN